MWIVRVVCFAAVTATASAAQSASVKEIFDKYKLFGTFAWNCGKPASKDNLYYVNRSLDALSVQRDQMSGPTTRDAVTILDRASEIRASEITVGGTRDGQPTEGLWLLEPNRQLGTEVSIGGKKVISDGKLLSTGREIPWLNKCSG